MQETKKNQRQVHLEVINLKTREIIFINKANSLLYDDRNWMCVESETTKTSVLEKQRTSTPTSFVNVIPLQKYIKKMNLLNDFKLTGKKS